MNLSDFWKDVLFYLTVPTCVGCGERLLRRENVFCEKCLSELENNLLRDCPECGKMLNGCLCVNRYLDAHMVHQLVKVGRYRKTGEEPPENLLIYSLKQDRRSDVIEFCAERMAQAIRNSIPDASGWTVTAVPRREAAIAKYGYDHSRELAKRIAKKLGTVYRPVLRSEAKKAQKGMPRDERRHNALFSLRNEKEDLTGERVLLVDDIVTTGSSMGNAAVMLRGAGAKKVVGVCFLIAYLLLPGDPARARALMPKQRKKGRLT